MVWYRMPQDAFLHPAGAMPKGWRSRMKQWEERQRVRLAVRQFCWDDAYYFHTTDQVPLLLLLPILLLLLLLLS